MKARQMPMPAGTGRSDAAIPLSISGWMQGHCNGDENDPIQHININLHRSKGAEMQVRLQAVFSVLASGSVSPLDEAHQPKYADCAGNLPPEGDRNS